MKLQVLLVLGVLSMAQAVSFFELVLEEWETYKLIHSKGYDNGMEEKFRMKIYMENKKKVAKHNAKAAKGQYSYHLAMNEFGDLLHHEFVAQMNGFKKRAKNETERPLGATYLAPAHVEKLPTDVDWRTHGAVTPVKNQGQCGSCWTFSTVASLESAYAKLTDDLQEFSEQDLVDCVKDYQGCCNGCGGGLMDSAFGYMMQSQSGADDMESNYAYTAEDGRCKYAASKAFTGAKITGFKDVTSKDEDALLDAVASKGVISIAVNAAHHWQLYSGGILDVSYFCNPDQLDHGVAVVGYGTEDKDYWIVRNSWGPSWGEQGYIRLVRGKNMCGVATQPSYPVMSVSADSGL